MRHLGGGGGGEEEVQLCTSLRRSSTNTNTCCLNFEIFSMHQHACGSTRTHVATSLFQTMERSLVPRAMWQSPGVSTTLSAAKEPLLYGQTLTFAQVS